MKNLRSLFSSPVSLGYLFLAATFLISLLLLLSGEPAAVQAAWGPSGCAPVGAICSTSVRQGWELHEGVWYFYRAGTQVAGYDAETKVYRTYDAVKDKWSEPGKAPWEKQRPGCSCSNCGQPDGSLCADGCQCGRQIEIQASGEPLQNFGLDRAMIGHRGEVYSINGKEVTAEKAAEVISGVDLTDDSAKLRITIVGSEAERKPVRADLENSPLLAAWKDKVLLQDYAPDDWSVSKTGFVTTGKPTVYLQSPTGKVLHCQNDYAGGAEAFAQAIRKADPNYKPEADKDRRKSDVTPIDLPAILKSPYTLWGALLALALIFRRKVNPS